MSVRDDDDSTGLPPDDVVYTTVDFGLFAFLVLFSYVFGLENLRVVTRTKRGVKYSKGGQPVWVTKFLCECGLDSDVNKAHVI